MMIGRIGHAQEGPDKFVNTNLVSFIEASTPFWDIILSETERFISLSRQFQASCFFSSFMSFHGRHMLTRAISPAQAARTVSTKNLSIIDTIPVYADGQEATEAKIVQLQFQVIMSAKVNFQFFDNPILCLSRELCSIFKNANFSFIYYFRQSRNCRRNTLGIQYSVLLGIVSEKLIWPK